MSPHVLCVDCVKTRLNCASSSNVVQHLPLPEARTIIQATAPVACYAIATFTKIKMLLR